ncbi:arylesterase [Sulfurimonas sp. HSL-3221]|uniref:arylesterase n=1 Tax=Sulfurimonadaceae TaxID=2771471 RepID=UPI001E302C07|nr:arylesterase [Sulfurimonas sp. HSL-3221]UFS61478.1 arylesterase [Sulfurimonas sp. HSL-3221]
MQTGDTILAFGDSITHGYGAAAHESYPAVLQTLTEFPVTNAGVNGETTAEGLARLPGVLEDDTIRLMLLCLGGNDILQQRSKRRLKANLKRIVQMAKAKGVDIVLIGVPTFGVFGMTSLPLYKEIAEEEGIPYMPSLLPDVLEDRALRADYVHPNAAGYRVIAEGLTERLRSLGYTE